MPIEIRELVIRATVDPAAGSGVGGAGGCGMPADKKTPTGEVDGATSADGDLVQRCVREVMRVLERKAER
jgi:hypothetical protein